MKKYLIKFFLAAFIAVVLCMNFLMSNNKTSLRTNLKDMIGMNKANAEIGWPIDVVCDLYCEDDPGSWCITQTGISQNPYISCYNMYVQGRLLCNNNLDYSGLFYNKYDWNSSWSLLTKNNIIKK